MTVVAVAGHNLPNEDGILGGKTDAYIRVQIGNLVRESSAVGNSLDPVWPHPGEDVPFGIFESGTPVRVQVYDADSNFLGGDDLIGEVTTWVPACSMFTSDQCEERTRLQLPGSPPCFLDDNILTPNPEATCIEVGFRIRPFQLRITQQPPLVGDDVTRVSVGIANPWPIGAADATAGVWIQDTSSQIWTERLRFQSMQGGYVVKLKAGPDDRASAVRDYVKFSVNYDAIVAVFRHEIDVEEKPVLPWLTEEYTQPNFFSLELRVDGTSTQGAEYIGHRKRVAAGSVVSIPGAAYQFGRTPNNQLIVVVKFVSDESPPIPADLKKFDRSAFMSLFWQFIFPLIPLTWWSCRLIVRLKFRCVWGAGVPRVCAPGRCWGCAPAAARVLASVLLPRRCDCCAAGCEPPRACVRTPTRVGYLLCVPLV